MKHIKFLFSILIISLFAGNTYAYRHVSPYAYCAGDPVNNVDFNGKEVVSKATGSKVIYFCGSVLTDDSKIQQAWNIAKTTETGKRVFEDALLCRTIINLGFDDEIGTYKGILIAGFSSCDLMGVFADITVFEGSINVKIEDINEGKSWKQMTCDIENQDRITVEEAIVSTVLHEFTHVVDEESNSQKSSNKTMSEREKRPRQVENDFHRELNENKKHFLINLQ